MSKTDSLNKVGFLIHPRDYTDFFVRYPYARILPEWLLEKITKKMSPLVVSKITGLKNKEGEPVEGYVLSLPLTAKTILEHRNLAQQQIVQAVTKAERLGIGILALGGLNASISKGGKTVADQNNVGITTGRAYTVKNVTGYIDKLVKDYNLPRPEITVAVVGAAGSIGSGCAIHLEKKGFRKFVLIDLERKLDRVTKRMKGLSDTARVTVDHQIRRIQEAEIVVAATNAPEALIKRGDAASGTFIVNDAQPSDIAKDVYVQEGVAVIEAGVVKTPGVSPNIDMGLATKDENFCCLVEAMILAQHGHFSNFSIGRLDHQRITEIEAYAEHTDFSLARPQNIFGYIDQPKLDRVAEKIHERIA